MGKERMIQVLLAIIAKPIIKMVSRKGGKAVLLIIGDLIFKATESKKDDELWAKIRPMIKKFK